MVCGRSSAPDHPRLTVKRHQGSHKPRKSVIFNGVHTGTDFRVFENTIDAAECAVKERVLWAEGPPGHFHAPIQPTVSVHDRLRPFYRALKCRATKTTPMTFQQFADSYQGRRQLIYSRAAADLDLKPFRDKDAVVKAFLKYEKYNFKYGLKKVVPRVISPRGPRYTVSLGVFIKPIEKRIFNIINHDLYKTPAILKGLNSKDRDTIIRAKWDRFADPIAIGLDAKRFDRHVTKPMLEWEHSIYKLFYPDDRHLSRLLQLQLRNKVYMNLPDGKLSYTTIGTRMSGDMNTSLGNCVISVAILYCFSRWVSVPMEICNDGDDSVIITERKYESRIRSQLDGYFRELGFLLEVEPTVDVFERIVFCQCQPVWTTDGYIMVRDPRVTLTKDSICLLDLRGAKQYAGWLKSVGLCGLSLAGGIPVVQEYYACFVRNGEGGSPFIAPPIEGGFQMLSQGMARSYSQINPRTRYSFWLAFDIDPAEQEAIEEYYSNLMLSTELDPYGLPCFVQLPIKY